MIQNSYTRMRDDNTYRFLLDSFLSLINLKYNHTNTCYALVTRGKVYCWLLQAQFQT